MGEYRVDTQDWQRWPKALIMRRVWSTNGHNRHREVRRYVPDGYAKEVEHKNANLRHMMEYYTDWAHDEVLKARGRENMERASADRLRNRIQEISADRDRLKAENEKLRELVRDMWQDIPKTECSFDVEEGCCDSYENCHGECALWYRMYELGIEAK